MEAMLGNAVEPPTAPLPKPPALEVETPREVSSAIGSSALGKGAADDGAADDGATSTSTVGAPESEALERDFQEPNTWTRRLLDTESATPAQLVKHTLIGLGFAAAYGLALGARGGLYSMGQHALGVPAAVSAVVILGLPALYIVLALFDAPLTLLQMGAAAARACISAGLALAGLAPIAALYSVSVQTQAAAAISGLAGLMLGGALGLVALMGALAHSLSTAPPRTRAWAMGVQLAFGIFAIALCGRVWEGLLPLVGSLS